VRVDVPVESADMDADLAGRTGPYMSEVITNALEHGLEGRDEGAIEMTLSRNDDRVVSTFTDDGAGMGGAD
jgi:two-component sensor histidine kinase